MNYIGNSNGSCLVIVFLLASKARFSSTKVTFLRSVRSLFAVRGLNSRTRVLRSSASRAVSEARRITASRVCASGLRTLPVWPGTSLHWFHMFRKQPAQNHSRRDVKIGSESWEMFRRCDPTTPADDAPCWLRNSRFRFLNRFSCRPLLEER